MKGVLLHGGHGTRLRPLTHTGPKQLIPVAGKPISQYCLEDMRSAGITEIAVILGSMWPEKVREYYGDGSKLGLKLVYIDQAEPKGLAHAVGLARKFTGDSKFVVYLADNLLKGGIQSYSSAFLEGEADAMVLLCRVSEPQRFGVAEFDEAGKLKGMIEKPRKPPSPYALVGVYFFSPIIFDAISKLKASWRGEFEITESIQHLLATGRRVEHRFVDGWWKDTGTPEDILEANRLTLDESIRDSEIRGTLEKNSSIEGRVKIEEGTIVKSGVTIRGPVYIGKNCTIEAGAYVGPYTSIGNDCRVAACEIENSIVMDKCVLDVGQRITGSLVGPESEIRGHQNSMPKGVRLVLGERSKLQL